MKTVLENINDVEKKLTVTYEWDEVKDDYDKLVRKLRKSLKLDGFRPGKVPLALAKRHLGPRIQYDFINQMIEKTFEDAVKNEGLQDHVGSSLEDVKFEENEPFVYEIKLEVDPEIELPAYKDGFEVKKKEYIIEDADVEKYLESVKKERAEVEKVDGEIEPGHFVTCDLVKTEDDSKQEDVQWQVGEKPLDGDLEKEFVGKKAGDELTAEIIIDDKPAEYKVTIKNVQKHTYPDINDEWVKENLETVESLEEWKKQIKESMVKELKDRAKYEYEQNIKNWFKENTDIPLPEARVEKYLEGMVKQFNYQQGGQSKIDPEEIKKFYRPQAEESVRWFLIEEKIKEEEGISVTSEDYDAKVDEMLQQYPEDQREQFRSIYNQDNYKQQLELQILSEKIFDHIKEFVKEDVEEIKTSELAKK
jgi:trigger factor